MAHQITGSKRLGRIILVFSILTGLAAWPWPGQANEFIIKPLFFRASPDQRIPFQVISASVFMVSQEMEPLDKVDLDLVESRRKVILGLYKNEVFQTLDGAAVPEKEGLAIIAGHRRGLLWTKTDQGWRSGGKTGRDAGLESGLYEKFAKALIQVGRSEEGYDRLVGQKLEIVPLSNPMKARSGDEVSFKVLLDGRPVKTNVYATYDGFSRQPGAYAYFAPGRDDGRVTVKITKPGVWMVRVEHIVPGQDDYDRHVLRSVLVFQVD